MGALLDRCLKATGRNYPPGYGFALTYLDDGLSSVTLRQAADRVVEDVFSNGHEGVASRKRHPDLVGYINAQATATSAEGWMIEAAQLVLAAAMWGNPNAARAMGTLGHPGY